MHEQHELLPPHMRIQDVWGLSDKSATPELAVNYLDKVRRDPDALESFRNAAYWHPLARFVVIAGAEFDDTGELVRQIELGMYPDGAVGRKDRHSHLYEGNAFVVGANDRCRFQSDYFFAVPPDTGQLSGVDFEEQLLIVNGVVHNDQPDAPPDYRLLKVGSSRLQKVGESTIGPFGWHGYNNTLVHSVEATGSMVLSFITKSRRRAPSLTTPEGLRFQGFDEEQVRMTEDFKTAQADTGRDFYGLSPIYVDADPDIGIEELSGSMQSKTSELSEGERDNVIEALFKAHDEIADWSRRLAA